MTTAVFNLLGEETTGEVLEVLEGQVLYRADTDQQWSPDDPDAPKRTAFECLILDGPHKDQVVLVGGDDIIGMGA